MTKFSSFIGIALPALLDDRLPPLDDFTAYDRMIGEHRVSDHRHESDDVQVIVWPHLFAMRSKDSARPDSVLNQLDGLVEESWPIHRPP